MIVDHIRVTLTLTDAVHVDANPVVSGGVYTGRICRPRYDVQMKIESGVIRIGCKCSPTDVLASCR